MESEIIETYTFNPQDYLDGMRKTDGKSFRDIVKEFEYDFHKRHSGEYALNLYANSCTMHLLERACGVASFLSYGMDLTQGNVFDAVEDPFVNHAIEKYSKNIIVYGIDSAYMETADGYIGINEEKGIFPLTLLIDNSMRDGTLRLATPTQDDEGEKENVVIDSPKFEYA
ncbi:MAG: hypothetical protein LUD00_00105 [Prevotellaceae bacterium]|nr:hypothetical protein [Prevotellaceae bacterium]